MEIFIFLALVIIIILLLNIQSRIRNAVSSNEENLEAIRKDLLKLKTPEPARLIPTDTKPAEIKKEHTPKPTDEEVVQWRPYVPPVIEKTVIPPVVEPSNVNETAATAGTPKPVAVIVDNTTLKKIIPMPAASSRTWWQNWMQNNPDLEKFVGENLINKIGIAVLVLGIGFFVKYAIDQNWINETGRVCIGICCGSILIGIAHYLRNSYRSFSSVLAGGGIAVFYFTIAFAYHEYQMFSQPVAFAIMVIITAFAVALALLYNKIELAVIAVIGGFIAPFLVSNGSQNYVALFIYLVILNVGMLVIAFSKKWPLLQILSFFFTLIIFGGWLFSYVAFSHSSVPYKNALLFASTFYLLFLTSVLSYNLRHNKPFKGLDISMVLLITFSYYSEGMFALGEWNDGEYRGIFTIILGLLNLSLAWFLFKSKKTDKNLLYLLIGLTLTFVSLAAPVQLKGHSITMFWSAECVLLYWLHQRSSIKIFKYSSAIILLLAMISIAMDWAITNERHIQLLPLIFINWQGIITNIILIIALGIYAVLLKKEIRTDTYLFEIKNKIASIGIGAVAIGLLYTTAMFIVNLIFSNQSSWEVPNAYHQLVTYIFVALAIWAFSRWKFLDSPTLAVALILLSCVFYFSSCETANRLINDVIGNQHPGVHGFVHWLSSAILLYLIYRLIQIGKTADRFKNLGFVLSIIGLLFGFFSIEFKECYVELLAKTSTIPLYAGQYQKAGLTIVWALFSFVMMWLGMKTKYKPLRIASLSIFTLALIKLFLFDIRDISAGGKIAAFIMLGVLLLVISFMYQRLKKIIIDNEEKNL